MDVILIVNPAAGARSGLRRAEEARDVMTGHGHTVEVAASRSAEHAGEISAEAVTRGVDRIVAVGGDGHIQAVANQLVGTDSVLGVIPAGTGNDIVRGLGIDAGAPTSLRRRLRVVRDVEVALGTADLVDLLRCSATTKATYVLSVATLGFSADVNIRADAMTVPRGSSRYTIATLLELPALEPVDLSMVVDGGDERVEATTFVAVANTSMFGGGMAIAPDAVEDDGLLDLIVIGAAPRLSVLRFLPAARRGAHMRDPRVQADRCRVVHIESAADHPSPVEVRGDGEAIGQLPMTFEVAPKALRVARPGLATNVAD